MNGISALIKMTPECSLVPFLPREDTWEVSHLQPGGGSSPQPDRAGPLMVNFHPPEL